MEPTTIAISVGTFIAILGILVLLRAKNSKYEVRPTDIVVAVLPIVIFLLVMGKIQRFEFGDLKIESAFVKASTSSIASQVTPLRSLPSESVRIDPKLGVSEIPHLIEKKTEGLLFRLGHGGYWGPAIEEYLGSLVKYPFLRYIIMEDKDGTFFALADARELTALLMGANPPYTSKELAQWLNLSDKSSLKKLPGFISSESAVSETTDKSQALQLMESLNADNLPVINKDKRFAGIVNRSRLTASLIIDVAKQLKGD